MAVRTNDEIMQSLRAVIGDDNSDESLTLIEDITDTLQIGKEDITKMMHNGDRDIKKDFILLTIQEQMILLMKKMKKNLLK